MLDDFNFLPSLEVSFLERIESKEDLQQSILLGFQEAGIKDMWNTAERGVDFKVKIK